MFLVDTNVLIYAADEDAAAHQKCRSLLEGWRGQASPWYLTWSIVYEFLRVTTHPRVFRRPWSAREAWAFLAAVLASPAVEVLAETQRHESVLSDMLASIAGLSGNVFHDVHTAAIMAEHGISVIYTRDRDFHRFRMLEVRDPLD